MFDLDKWQEILDTIRKNKLRTFLTAFSVAWGIFMLVVLLGSGKGLEHGVQYQFRDDAMNSIWIFPGQTSMPYKGLQPGRSVQLTNRDYDEIRGVGGVEHITSRFYIAGNLSVSHGNETGTFDVRAVHPDHQFLEKTIVTAGRFLNPLDVREFRKSAVLGKLVAKALFKNESPLGQDVKINGIAFRVVGLFEDVGGESEMEKIYIPISTAQRTFNGADRINQIMLTTGDAALDRTEALAQQLGHKLATRHNYAAEDKRAVFIRNNMETFQRFVGLMASIRSFIWVIGCGTILAGVVGVGNIMLITVRDRTKEIGIRKAVGATPWSIVGLILHESVLITSVAGYVGLVLGVAILEVVSGAVPGSDFFRHPEVDLRVAIEATVLLVVAGTVAGLFPAVKAATIRPIEALRDE